MKKKIVSQEKKLTLGKLTVAGLSHTEQQNLKGGANTISPSCQYTFCFCVTILTRCC
ncbi:class I lanthipeptide [Chitinophaga nivalis]|uniref:class I lanthipeptide n=1 Tax=Chitinophaga nivalis TaxID=2991709 RepID=UPI003530F3E4